MIKPKNQFSKIATKNTTTHNLRKPSLPLQIKPNNSRQSIPSINQSCMSDRIPPYQKKEPIKQNHKNTFDINRNFIKLSRYGWLVILRECFEETLLNNSIDENHLNNGSKDKNIQKYKKNNNYSQLNIAKVALSSSLTNILDHDNYNSGCKVNKKIMIQILQKHPLQIDKFSKTNSIKPKSSEEVYNLKQIIQKLQTYTKSQISLDDLFLSLCENNKLQQIHPTHHKRLSMDCQPTPFPQNSQFNLKKIKNNQLLEIRNSILKKNKISQPNIASDQIIQTARFQSSGQSQKLEDSSLPIDSKNNHRAKQSPNLNFSIRSSKQLVPSQSSASIDQPNILLNQQNSNIPYNFNKNLSYQPIDSLNFDSSEIQSTCKSQLVFEELGDRISELLPKYIGDEQAYNLLKQLLQTQLYKDSKGDFFNAIKISFLNSNSKVTELIGLAQIQQYLNCVKAVKITQSNLNISLLSSSLSILNLSHNNIKSFPQSFFLPNLQFLNVNNNQIRNIHHLLTFQSIIELHTRNNLIDHISGGLKSHQLQLLQIGYNLIQNQYDIYGLNTLKSIKIINIVGNPMTKSNKRNNSRSTLKSPMAQNLIKQGLLKQYQDIYIFSQFKQYKDITFGSTKENLEIVKQNNQSIKNKEQSLIEKKIKTLTEQIIEQQQPIKQYKLPINPLKISNNNLVTNEQIAVRRKAMRSKSQCNLQDLPERVTAQINNISPYDYSQNSYLKVISSKNSNKNNKEKDKMVKNK